MSNPDHGKEMDRPLKSSGSVKRARERAQAGIPLGSPPPPYQQDSDEPQGDLRPPPRRPLMAPPISYGGQSRLPKLKQTGAAGQAISKPTQVPQWPLPGPPITPPSSSDSEPYRLPPGRPKQAPQRPPRPSDVPSILDQSRLQDPTPVFLIPEGSPDSSPEYNSSVPPTPSSRMTSSSMGSIPDFPVPVAVPAPTTGPPRRSANLGPPPSSRRGASSFYSNASFVSPIPEESPGARSHGSYASSAAMPDNWPDVSPEPSPTFYEDTDTEKSRESIYDEFHDESKLVRSASIGKRGKPSLINTKSTNNTDQPARPAPSPVQPFNGGIGSVDASTNSSNTLPMAKSQPANPTTERLTPDAILGAYAAAGATDLTEVQMATHSISLDPQNYSHLSAIRRPPKLDIDAVRDMEARGSMTSLPDLIRRATRLATLIDRGKRPASRFENFGDYLEEKSDARIGDKDVSGLSDMLAAFPPPGAQNDRQSRGSWFRTNSWPLVPSRQDGTQSRSSRRGMTSSHESPTKKTRRCCGLPKWAFVVVVFIILCLVAAAIVVPLQLLVLNKNNDTKSELSECQASLVCKNGGTNVISQGVCSCICTNGFTGSDCSAGGSDGCTTTDLVSVDGQTNISNVTLGKAIPRLIADGNTNFSIPLSGKAVLAKLNAADLSCIAQNSLVTFDGQSTRVRGATAKVEDVSGGDDKLLVAEKRAEKRAETTTTESISVITISPDIIATTLLVDEGTPSPVSTADGADETERPAATQTGTATTSAAPTSQPTDAFTVTEEVLDFARVVVLYVLQEENEENAQAAQTRLQRFFTKADSREGATKTDATNIQIGGDNTINLIAYTVNIGRGAVGGKRVKRHLAGRYGRSIFSTR